MKKASITETKNNLSRLIDEVKNGASILILDRTIPVAKLEPLNSIEISGFDLAASLVRRGLAATPRHQLDVTQFLDREKTYLPIGVSSVKALLKDREEGR
ncbi:MAG TPA: hypothetical protein ENI15_20760 [Spirochaetes bacterium]|nr:hypothetical protein [Spirochaetota bacterium]